MCVALGCRYAVFAISKGLSPSILFAQRDDMVYTGNC